MEENDSSISEKKVFNYFNLLQEIDKLLNFSTDSNNPRNVTEDTWDASEIDTIFNNLVNNIDSVCNQMSFQKKSMFLITIFNTLLRVCVVYEPALIIPRTTFQSIFERFSGLLWSISAEEDCNSLCASDLLDSMLTNLAKDGLAEKCFKRLLSNEMVSIIGNGIYKTISSVHCARYK
jgi:hypothetical protein